jgi:hydrogenase-4 component F
MVLVIFFILAIIISAAIFSVQKKGFALAMTSIFICVQIALSVYAFIHKGETDSVYFRFDSLGVLLSMILSILCVTTLYHSTIYLKHHNSSESGESIYYACMNMLIAAMTGAYFANHFAVMWVCIESTTLFVALLIYHDRSKIALEAAWKYLYVSSIGVTIAFMGILFLSAISSSTHSSLEITQLIATAKDMDPTFLKITFLLILTGLSAKMGIVPLHTVTVDAHTAAPFPISAFISTTLMNVGFLGIFRMFTIVSHSSAASWANTVLMIVGVASVCMSAIQLLRIKHFKRMFAFSSLEHMGIVILALSLGRPGFYAAILQITFHSFVKAGLFYQIGQVSGYYKSYWIAESGKYFKINPAGALAIILGFLSITAMPPSGLFLSEFLVLKSLFLTNHYILAGLILFLLTVIIYVFGRHLFHLLYAELPENCHVEPQENSAQETLTQFVLFGLVILLGFYPPAFFTDLITSIVAY